jgi:hypothetical protein
MTDGLLLFLHRCRRIAITPGQETEQIVLNRFRLGGWILHWLATSVSTYWVGEAFWPGLNSVPGILAIALAAAFPLMLVEAFVLHLAGRLLGHGGRWDVLIALCGYAAVPGAVLAIVFVGAIIGYTHTFGPIRFPLAFIFLFILALIVAVITGLVILRHGLGANYRLSARRAWILAILGSLLLSMGESMLRAPYITKGAVPIANILAMPQIPAPPAITAGGATGRLAFEYAANLRYYRKFDIRRGDIVILDINGHYRMGRILGLPGEQAGLQDGHLLVNGSRMAEPWQTVGELSIQSKQLGTDEYFIYTDERKQDPDSGLRFPAAVKRDRILGPALKMNIALLRWIFGQSARTYPTNT